MIKTAVMFEKRPRVAVAGRMDVEWPDHLTNEAIATIRAASDKYLTTYDIAGPKVASFCRSLHPMRVRASVQDYYGPYVLNFDYRPENDELVAWFRSASEEERIKSKV